MTNSIARAAKQILQAATFYDLFGACPTGIEPTTHVKSTYRQLARLTHPDATGGTSTGTAFTRLNELYRQAIAACTNGSYDKPQVLATITGPKGVHTVQRPWQKGDLCDTYQAESHLKSGATKGSFCKIVRDASYNDLLQVEASALKMLRGDGTNSRLHAYYPELLDSFSYADGTHKRRAHVLGALDGFYSLADVRAAYAEGIRPIDAAWMWRRIVWALAHAHQQGIIHGALVPDHILIHPGKHGVVLVDWCYASIADNTVQPALTAIVNRYTSWYPTEVLTKQSPSAATDLGMAARCMIYVMGGDPVTGNFYGNRVATPFRAFFRGCIQTAQTARPQDALQLLSEFDELLERLGTPYYPRRFRPFAMPTGLA